MISISAERKSQLSLLVILILYIVGVLGVLVPLHPQFMLLTPLNLMVTAIIVLYNHPHRDPGLAMMGGIIFVLAYLVELAGVHTGVIFGEYSYGATLGPKLMGVPLVIGLNWLVLLYGSSALAHQLGLKNPWLVMIGSASLMTGYDILLEHIAIRHDFWRWTYESPNNFLAAPVQNYVAWWLVAFALSGLFQLRVPKFQNKVAIGLFILQFIFFSILLMFAK